MASGLTILITGFGPFPGAPYNPSAELAGYLAKLRRPALADIDRVAHVFTVSYAAVDRDLPELIAEHQPDALLMFGLATRTPYLRIETRAQNRVTDLWPDAAHTQVRLTAIDPDGDALQFGPHTELLLRAAQATGIDARRSRDAGRYLCNYLSYRAIEATHHDNGPRLAAFIHVPLIARQAAAQRPGVMGVGQLMDAGEALLMETVRLARVQAVTAA